ncbi:hypothetical protein ACFLY4_06485, partial [Chloroflexota bacterium]
SSSQEYFLPQPSNTSTPRALRNRSGCNTEGSCTILRLLREKPINWRVSTQKIRVNWRQLAGPATHDAGFIPILSSGADNY